jgi:NAD(P)H-hydrate repair Nnr-like enzyme with NAD(P)H-hydrate dehydratase domain
VVVSGELAATGAARMAARGALRAGAGLVTVASPRDALAVNATALTAVMVRLIDTLAEFAELWTDKRLNTCVIGPGAGVGDRTRDFVATCAVGKAKPGAGCRRADELCGRARSSVRSDQGLARSTGCSYPP